MDYGFTQSLADYSMFTYKQGSLFTVAVIYVNDILLTGDNISMIADLKVALHEEFSIKDLGEAKYYLGLEVARNDTDIFLINFS